MFSTFPFTEINVRTYVRSSLTEVATPLLELTCHMGSHSVTCHPAEVTFQAPALTPAEAGTRFSDTGRMQAWVDLVGWLRTAMVYPPKDGSPIQVLTGPDVG